MIVVRLDMVRRSGTQRHHAMKIAPLEMLRRDNNYGPDLHDLREDVPLEIAEKNAPWARVEIDGHRVAAPYL